MSQQSISSRLQQSRRKHEQRRAAKRKRLNIALVLRLNKETNTLTGKRRSMAQALLNRSKLHAS